MRNKALFLGVVGLAMVMTLLGLWQYTTIRATGPADLLPMQPFNPQAVGGIGANLTSGAAPMTLGDRNVQNYTSTDIIRGERFGVPWIYSGPGFDLDPFKKGDPDGVVGTIISTVDANCQSTSNANVGVAAEGTDHGGAVPNLPSFLGTPYDWEKTTTNVEGVGGDSWLKSIVPPYSWIFRHTSSMDNLWVGGITARLLAPPLVLNTVYTSVPFSPNNSAFTATTKLGGNPNLPTISSAICTDSPQSSISITTPYSNPPKLGDSGRPCLASDPCADAAVNGLWTDNVIDATAGAVTKTVTSKIFNSGPQAGTFSYHWDIELTNSAIATAVWMPANATQDATPVVGLAAGATLAPTNNLRVSCVGPTGEGLVVLKGILWPVIPITREPYPDDNASIFVVKVVCTSAPASQVDKEVIWVKPDLSVGGSSPGVDDPRGWTKDASHVETVMGDPGVIVYLDELKANHEPTDVNGREWLEAETFAPGPIVIWSTALTIDQGMPPGASKTAAWCDGTGTDKTCITFDVLEPFGQSDVHAQALIRCPLSIPEGEYSVVVKAIDAPLGVGESKPSDNAARMVIDVFCWESETHHTLAMDGIDDGAGLYAKWTVFLSDPDKRKPFESPPSLSSDTAGAGGAGVSPPNGGYFERLVRLECYWMDADGCNRQTPTDSTADVGVGGINASALALPVTSTAPFVIGQTILVQHEQMNVTLIGAGQLTVVRGAKGTIAMAHLAGVSIYIVTVVSCDVDDNDYVDATESHADYQLAAAPPLGLGGYAAIDSDGDCVQDYASAQPGHPIEDEATQPAGECTAGDGWTVYAGKPNDGVNTKAEDNDCDGLVDGVERAYGSSPKLADTDLDGAKDFVELFQFTSPLNPDTDGDGYADKPVSTYSNDGGGAIPTNSKLVDNCPSGANPNQKNTDGQGRANGPSILGDYASNPGQDKLGDACDTDDDNDGLADTGEALCVPNPVAFDCPPTTCFCDLSVGTRPTATTCKLNGNPDGTLGPNKGCDPKVADTDGDRCTDLTELLTGKDPLNPASMCVALTMPQLKFFRACRWNLPQPTEDGGYWATAQWSTNTDRTELDADGDGVNCMTITSNIGDDDNDNGTFTPPADSTADVGTGGINASATTLPVTSTAPFAVTGIIQVEQEWMKVTAVGSGQLTVTRAQNGTTAAAHAAGVSIYTVTVPPLEINDNIEIEGYYTNASLRDTDGDGCDDWLEIMDVNGDRSNTVGDLSALAKRSATNPPAGYGPDPISDGIYDVNKDTLITVGDLSLMARNTCLTKPFGAGCFTGICPNEN